MSCKPLKISEMPGVHCLRPSDLLPIVRDGENRALTLDQLFHTFKELLPPPPHHGGDCLEAIRKACDALALANKALMAADQSYRIARDSWDLANTNKDAIVDINSQICEILLRLDALEQDEGSKITIITNETDPKQIVYTFKDNNEIIATVTVPKFAADLTTEDLSNMIPDAEAVKISFEKVDTLLGDRVVDGEYVAPAEGLLANTTSFSQADEVLAQAIGEAGNFNVEYSDYIRNNMNNSRAAKEALTPIATIIKGEQQTVLYAPYGDKVTVYPPHTSKGLDQMPDGGVIASIGIRKGVGTDEEIFDVTIPTKLSLYNNDANYQDDVQVGQAIQTAINNLINGAGEQLDTLRELADALNNDANFATTITNLINAKYTKPEGGIPKSDLADDVLKLSDSYEANLEENIFVEGGDTYEEAIAKLDGIITNNEEVTAAALNDLNDKKANKSELADVAFSGDYHDLTNTPAIPDEFIQQQVDWNATEGVTSIANKPNLATVATTGNYFDLETLPVIPPGTMFVEITEDGGNYVSDKTFNEIKEAYLGNAPIVCRYRDVIYPLTSYQGIAFVFGNTFPHDTDYEHTDIVISEASGVTFVEKETNLVLGVKVNNGDTIRPTDGIVNLNISEGGGGTIDNISVNDIEGTVTNKIAEVTITGADVNVTGFAESEETNDNLEIQESDSVNDALGKLQKALIDDETTLVRAFNAIKDATGFSDELQYVEVSDTADILYDIHDLQSADTKLASEIQNLKNREGKVNTFTVKQGEKQVTYSPHYSGDVSENKTINLLGADFINLTRELPPATNINVQEGESSDYYTLNTAVRTIAEKPAGTVPMNPGIVYTWEESAQVWSTYQYIGPNSTAEEFRNIDNWIKRW